MLSRCFRRSSYAIKRSTFTKSFSTNDSKTPLSQEQVERIFKRQEEIRADHLGLNSAFPNDATTADDKTLSEKDLANRKRLIYRSKQRGLLEVDLLLGSWAAKNVMSLTADEIIEYEKIVNMETIDIFNCIISSKVPIPEELQTPMMTRLQAYVKASPLGKASVAGFLDNKKHMSN